MKVSFLASRFFYVGFTFLVECNLKKKKRKWIISPALLSALLSIKHDALSSLKLYFKFFYLFLRRGLLEKERMEQSLKIQKFENFLTKLI